MAVDCGGGLTLLVRRAASEGVVAVASRKWNSGGSMSICGSSCAVVVKKIELVILRRTYCRVLYRMLAKIEKKKIWPVLWREVKRL